MAADQQIELTLRTRRRRSTAACHMEKLRIIKCGEFRDNNGLPLRTDGSLFWADVVLMVVYNVAGALIGFAKLTLGVHNDQLFERRRKRVLGNCD